MLYIILELFAFLGLIASFLCSIFVILTSDIDSWQFTSSLMPVISILTIIIRLKRASWSNNKYGFAIIIAKGFLLLGHYGLLSSRTDYYLYPSFACILLATLFIAIGVSMPSIPKVQDNMKVNVFGRTRSFPRVPDALWRATRVPLHFTRRGIPILLLGMLVSMILAISNPESPVEHQNGMNLRRWEIGLSILSCGFVFSVLMWRTCARIGYLAPSITASKLLRTSRFRRAKKVVAGIALAPFAFTNEYYEPVQKRNHFQKLLEESVELMPSGQEELVPLDGFDSDAEDEDDSNVTYKPKIASLGWLLLCPCYRKKSMENNPLVDTAFIISHRSKGNSAQNNPLRASVNSHGMRHRTTRLNLIDKEEDRMDRLLHKRIREGKTLLKGENRTNQWFGFIGSLMFGFMLLFMLQYHFFTYWKTLHTANFLSIRRFWTALYNIFMHIGQIFFLLSIPITVYVPFGLDDAAISPIRYLGNPKHILVLLPPDHHFDARELAGLYYTFTRRGHVVKFFSSEGKAEKRRLRRLVEASPGSIFGLPFAKFKENVQSAGMLPLSRSFEEHILSLSEWDASSFRKESLMRVAKEILNSNVAIGKRPSWLAEELLPSPWELRPFGGGMYPDVAAMYAEMVTSKEWKQIASWVRRDKQIKRNQSKMQNAYLHASKAMKNHFRKGLGDSGDASVPPNELLGPLSNTTPNSPFSSDNSTPRALFDPRNGTQDTMNDEKQSVASSSSQYSGSTNVSSLTSGSGEPSIYNVSPTSFAYGFDAIVVPTCFERDLNFTNGRKTSDKKRSMTRKPATILEHGSHTFEYSSMSTEFVEPSAYGNEDAGVEQSSGWLVKDIIALKIVKDFIDAQKPVLTFGNGISVLSHVLNATSPESSLEFFPEIPAPPTSIWQLIGCRWLRKRNRVYYAWRSEALRLLESHTATFVWPTSKNPVNLFKAWFVWFSRGEWLVNGYRRALYPQSWLQRIQEVTTSQSPGKHYNIYGDLYRDKDLLPDNSRFQSSLDTYPTPSTDTKQSDASFDAPHIVEGIGFIAALCAGDVFIAAHLLLEKIENAALVF